MKKIWRQMLTMCCAVLLFMTVPGITVLANERQHDTPLSITDEQEILTGASSAQKSFSDVQDKSHPYYKAIYWAADAGITKGYSDGTFGINRSCTRGEMMMFLWRYAGKPAPKTASKSPFKDVPKTHTFYKAILWGSQKGITKGYSDGTFGINRNVSRGECMMFLWRLKGKPAPKAVAKAPFPDVPKSHVFYNAVLWGYQKKITTGFTSGKLKGKFGVNENCSRGQIVTFLYRTKFGAGESTESTTYTVSFESNGGSEVYSQQVKKGECASEPNTPTFDGYNFGGWYIDEQLTKEYSFTDAVTADIKLYAKWEEIPTMEPTDPPVVEDLDEIDPDIAIYSFDTDTRSIPVNTPTEVIFTAEILANITLENEDVIVMNSNGEVVGYMNDEGLNGDEEGEDSVYTLKVELESDDEKYVNYYVSVNGVNSEAITIGYFIPMSDSELSDMEKVDISLEEFVASDEFQNASIEERITLAATKLNQLADEGLIIKESIYYNSWNTLYEFEYSCGVLGSIMLQDISDEYNTDGSLKDSSGDLKPDAKDTPRSEEAEVLFPTAEEICGSISDDGNYSALILNAFENSSYRRDYYNSLRSDWDNMGLTTTVDTDVTVADMKNIKGYNVVVFAMHGNHDTPSYNRSSTVPIFSINENVTTQTDKTYSYELNTRRSVKKVRTTNGIKYWVFPRLFEDNYSSTSLKEQMIFSESCKFFGCDCLSTAQDNTLASVFTRKGAEVVVGYHNSVGADYSRDIMKDVIEDSFTGSSISTAVDEAQKAHGVNDANRTDGMEDTSSDKYKAYPCIIGNRDFIIRPDGSLSGLVLNAENEQAISKAVVRVYKDGKQVRQTKTSSAGSYRISGLDAGTYILQISASKYKSVRTEIIILPGEDSFVETTLLMSISGIASDSANGIVTNAVTGEELADVTVRVRNNWNNETGTVISTTTTNQNGYYSISNSTGFYTLEFSKDGFITLYKNVFIGVSAANSFNVAISPESVEGIYRIVLTWGENPSDLDSHLSGYTASGYSFHVYYSDKNAYDNDALVCNLDLDDTTSYGPETVTLTANSSSPYYYYIYHYAGSGSISTSSAQVKVFSGNTLLRTFNAPTNQGTSRYWNVFAIVNGRLVVSNTITSSPDTSYASVSNGESTNELVPFDESDDDRLAGNEAFGDNVTSVEIQDIEIVGDGSETVLDEVLIEESSEGIIQEADDPGNIGSIQDDVRDQIAEEIGTSSLGEELIADDAA